MGPAWFWKSRRAPDPEEIDRWLASLDSDAVDHLVALGTDEVVSRLVRMIDDDDELRRARAATVLGRLRERRAVDALVKAIEHPSDWLLRQEAIEALGEIGDAGAVEPLLWVLENDDDDEHLRSVAARALGRIGSIDALEPLERAASVVAPDRLVDDPIAAAAHDAVLEIRARHPRVERAAKPHSGRMLARLSDPDPDVRLKAIERIGHRADPTALPALVRALADEAASIRAAAAAALGELGDRSAVSPLIPLLHDVSITHPDPSYAEGGPVVCSAAARALERLGGPQAEAALLDAAEDASPVVRHDAAVALSSFRNANVLRVLDALVDDPVEEVRSAAVGALAGWRLTRKAERDAGYSNGDVLDILERAARDADRDIRCLTVYPLGEFLPEPRALALLRHALGDRDAWVRRDALSQLQTHRLDSVHPRLVEMLRRDEDEDVRRAAADALSHYARAEDMDLLIEALSDPSGAVRRSAVHAIGALYEVNQGPHRDAVPHLMALKDDPYPDMRLAVCTVLGKFGIDVPLA